MKCGFIGTGNMGAALAQAAAKSGQELFLANRTREKAEALQRRIGGTVTDNAEAAEKSDVLFLGVKPQNMPQMLQELAPVLKKRGSSITLVTMAAGISCARLQELAGGPYPVLRLMPNTPAKIGEGVILWCELGVKEPARILAALQPAGELVQLEEKLMDAGSALSGCGPAFVYLFLEALADGGVACGLPRSTALLLAAQTLRGSAGMVLSGEHPAALKDAVCSPGGSTIQGVRVMEENGLRAAAMDAVCAAFEKTCALGK